MGENGTSRFYVFWVSLIPLSEKIALIESCRMSTNIIVSSMLILGGSATVTVRQSRTLALCKNTLMFSPSQDLTGMSTIAVRHLERFPLKRTELRFRQACFLIPLGVAIYVVVGGMRSTLLCD
jgi:urea-proton symporter